MLWLVYNRCLLLLLAVLLVVILDELVVVRARPVLRVHLLGLRKVFDVVDEVDPVIVALDWLCSFAHFLTLFLAFVDNETHIFLN